VKIRADTNAHFSLKGSSTAARFLPVLSLVPANFAFHSVVAITFKTHTIISHTVLIAIERVRLSGSVCAMSQLGICPLHQSVSGDKTSLE
jgi:hypothetical protein